MKTFIFAVCIFILCGALVLFNSAYITSKAVGARPSVRTSFRIRRTIMKEYTQS